MIWQRFQRWCHQIARLYVWLFAQKGEPCQAIDITRSWRTLNVACTCGREWK